MIPDGVRAAGLGSSGNPLHPITDQGEVAQKLGQGDDDGAAAVVGMETEGRRFAQATIEEEDDMMVGIVDESEGTDAAGFETEVAHHAFG